MSNYKINRNRPKLNKSDIDSAKDFNSVLKQVQVTPLVKTAKSFYKTGWFYAGMFAAAITVAVVMLYKPSGKNTAIIPEKQNEKMNESVSVAENTAIIPPLKEMDVPYDTYKIDAQKGGEIVHKTGSKIKIPGYGFVDKSGKVVTGEITIRYREFHNVVDIFLSGIPMTYDSAGAQYTFESAGMLDIQGFNTSGEEMKIAPGKKIGVEMVSGKEGEKYNQYKLNTESRKWSYIGKDKIIRGQKTLNGKMDQERRDSFMLDAVVFEDGRPIVGNSAITKRNISITEKKIDSLKTSVAKAERALPPKPKLINNSNYHFDLDVNKKEFPELAIYDKIVFEVGSENKGFTSNIYKTVWEDAILQEGENQNSYAMVLKKGAESHKFSVYPVFSEGDINAALEKYSAKNKSQLEQVNFLKKSLVQNEKKREEYLQLLEEEKRKAKQAQLSASGTGYMEIRRIFEVSDFGIYNSDHPFKYKNPVNVVAKYMNQGKTYAPQQAYIIDKGKDILFANYDSNIRFDPSSDNILFFLVISEGENRLAVFDEKKFKEIPNGKTGEYIFEMAVSDENMATAGEVKKKLGL